VLGRFQKAIGGDQRLGDVAARQHAGGAPNHTLHFLAHDLPFATTLTDSIILLRYVEMFGEMKRGLTVLKMRGSIHDKGIREFNIDASAMHLGRRFRNVTGILSGTPIHLSNPDVDRAWSQADEEGLRRRAAAAGGGVIQRRQSDRREELA
jgi:hypothetical protein